MSVAFISRLMLFLINRDASEMSNKFLYFAYGSNLLAQRLHINNPSAVRVTSGKLEDTVGRDVGGKTESIMAGICSKLAESVCHSDYPTLEQTPEKAMMTILASENYRLDFGTVPSRSWGGTPATIVPDESEHCWGAIWEIDFADLPNLDRQEGVDAGIYFPLNVTVTSPEGVKYNCRTYQLVKIPPTLKAGEEPPLESRPSYIYLQVILQGAKESQLPEDYFHKLQKIKHNGYTGNVEIPVQISVGNNTSNTE